MHLLVFVVALFIVFCLGITILRRRRQKKSIAFFHPYCNSGGGGERVLWRAILALQENLREWEIIIYAERSNVTDKEILDRAKSHFRIDVDPNRVQIIRLRYCRLIKPCSFATLFLQLFGGLLLGIEALLRFVPDVFIDSTGVPLTLPVFQYFGGSKVASYVHYPTITDDMLELVHNGVKTYNNRGWIASFYIFTLVKMLYYYLMKQFYTVCIANTHVILTNGSWTHNHILKMRSSVLTRIVYPPCDVEAISRPAEEDVTLKPELMLCDDRHVNILSVGQIRPEKNHELQLSAFAEARRLLQEQNNDIKLTLIIAGGCRDEVDFARLEALQQLAQRKYNLTNGEDVLWRINVKFSELLELLHSSLIGIHTMWNEHFGISVVEMLASGTIMVAHDSGGPKLDIIGGFEPEINNVPCGFLASTKEGYARHITKIVDETRDWRDQVRAQAKESVQRFSDENFEQNFVSAVRQLIC